MIRRILLLGFLFIFSNCLIIPYLFRGSAPLIIGLFIVAFLGFIIFNITPRFMKDSFKRFEVLMDGRELLVIALVLFFADLFFAIFFLPKMGYKPGAILFGESIALGVLFITTFNGVLRIIGASTQMSILMKLILFLTWWIPLINFFVCWRCCRIARREYVFERYKDELNEKRKDSDVCKTKYPLLMVHGIFWRDWQFFNYWGRISKELLRNGAVVYYGNQQSAAPMEVCALELKEQILRIIETEHCEKVNIIAHSKGGLDARYAISCQGAAPYVASLTTVGAPHRGCGLVDLAMRKIPEAVMSTLAKGYNAMYRKLGDKDPDLISGIKDLTTEQCALFNDRVADQKGVLYQSVASKMSGFSSAGFPLNVGYAVLRRTDGENDGFVSVESSKWGRFLGCYETGGRRGVSHGDTIDLTRKNIKGFDACECYVDIVKGLKGQGL